MPDDPEKAPRPNGDRRARDLFVERRLRFLVAAFTLQMLVVIVGFVVVAGFPPATGGLIGANQDRADESRETADNLAGLVGEIQRERERNIRRACRADNRQVKRLNRELDRFNAPAEARRFFRAVLPPRRNCDVVVARQIPSATEAP